MSAPKYEDHKPLPPKHTQLSTPSSWHSACPQFLPLPSHSVVRARVEFLLHFVCKCKCRLAFAHFKLVPGNRAGIQVMRGEACGGGVATFLFVHLCARSRGLILAPRHFWSWVIGMCSAFLYISHSLQENETKVYAPRPRARKREQVKRECVRARESKSTHPLCNLSDYVARLAGKRYEYN